MKSQGTKPALFSTKEGELYLSGPALFELLQAVFDKGMSFRFKAKGFSMSPFIKDGDVVTIFPLAGASPRLGDVVVFVHPEMGRLIIHRVAGKRGDSILIRGDNTNDADGLIPKANILGRVTKVERDEKEVFLGLGPERILIAFLTRKKLLFPLLLPVWRLIRPIIRRSPK